MKSRDRNGIGLFRLTLFLSLLGARHAEGASFAET
jgi:hypothetical protein